MNIPKILKKWFPLLVFLFLLLQICDGQTNKYGKNRYIQVLCPKYGNEKEILKNNGIFDDCQLDYLPRFKHTYTTKLGELNFIKTYFQIEDLINSILIEDYNRNHQNLLKIRKINANELSSSALPRFFSIKKSLYIYLEINKDGTVTKILMRDNQLTEEQLKHVKKLHDELKKSIWNPGLYRKKPVNASLNYLVIF